MMDRQAEGLSVNGVAGERSSKRLIVGSHPRLVTLDMDASLVLSKHDALTRASVFAAAVHSW